MYGWILGWVGDCEALARMADGMGFFIRDAEEIVDI